MLPRDKGKCFKQLKNEDKSSILILHAEGFSSRKIAARLGWDQSIVILVIQNSKKLQNDAIPSRKKGSGRPRKVTYDLLKMRRRQITKYPTMTDGDLRETVLELSSMSDQTIQYRYTKKFGAGR
jgi:transposase